MHYSNPNSPNPNLVDGQQQDDTATAGAYERPPPKGGAELFNPKARKAGGARRVENGGGGGGGGEENCVVGVGEVVERMGGMVLGAGEVERGPAGAVPSASVHGAGGVESSASSSS